MHEIAASERMIQICRRLNAVAGGCARGSLSICIKMWCLLPGKAARCLLPHVRAAREAASACEKTQRRSQSKREETALHSECGRVFLAGGRTRESAWLKLQGAPRTGVIIETSGHVEQSYKNTRLCVACGAFL